MENDDNSALMKQLVAMNDSIDELREKSDKNMKEVRKSTMKAAMDLMTEEQRDSLRAKVEESDDEEAKEALKAVDRQYDKYINPKPKVESTSGTDIGNSKAMKESERLRSLGATVQALTAKAQEQAATIQELHGVIDGLQMTEKQRMVDDMIALKASLIKGIDEDSLRAKWMERSNETIKQMYEDQSDTIGALKAAKANPTPAKQFGFNMAAPAEKLHDLDDLVRQAGVM